MNNKGSAAIWLIVLIMFMFVLYVGGVFTPTQPEAARAVCGNGRCELGESQANCPSDCGGVTGGDCVSDITPDIDINCYDIDNVNTALTEANNIYRKVGETSWTTWTQGTELTSLECGATYEFVAGISTSDFTDNAYGPHFFWTVPPVEDTTMQLALYDDDIETELTCTFVNADDNPSTAEVFAAGQTQTVSFKVYAANEDYFGNPYIAQDPIMSDIDNGKHRKKYPNCINAQLNSTSWEKPVKAYFTRLDGTGDELNRISCPGLSDSASTDISYCYECPVIDDTVARVYFKLEADGTAGNAPTVDDTFYIYAGNYYIDDDGNLAWGCETDLLAYVGTDDADECTLDVT